MTIFSVSITDGSELMKILPSNQRVNGGFYWYYSLYGNDVMHEPFGDLNHEFPTERASLNLQGTKASISRFIISELNPIEVHLCHEEQSLATAHVDFGQIFEKSFKTAKIDQEPLRISGKSLKYLSCRKI